LTKNIFPVKVISTSLRLGDDTDQHMGRIQAAKCRCGYRTSVTTGGSMREFRQRSYFPFYCKDCGIVDVNIQEKDLVCPSCKSSDIKEYGKPPISIESTEFPYVQCFNYGAPQEGNLCPKCKEMTLEFQSSDLLFD
jgi:RNA polymerase subunit RPABC4/transcription elongation factor Spt4